MPWQYSLYIFLSTASFPSKIVKEVEADFAFIPNIKVCRAFTDSFEHICVTWILVVGKDQTALTSLHITDRVYCAYIEWLTIWSVFSFLPVSLTKRG